MPARLSATDLACRRGDRVLFRGLSLALGPGGLLHVTGANGIGKSSLLRIMAGLLSPYGGNVESDGAIGLVDERPALDPELPLGKALGFWQRIDGAHDQSANLAAMGLSELLDIPVRYLSTGQRKRAALARLLAQQVPIWLLDEPLNGLDTAAQAKVLELVGAHAANGGVTVIASHQPVALAGLQTLALEEFAA
ncbi:heme ABC exporter ATP-binding protein CcmA [Altererythrobacter arenosus]|uniref:Heme ABC exporter ATP-binding protein CcmA n=1 Tax=Altererythrobacter arenosus TaxID=3032592 RepID=A0ABY8FUS3_9SPHN|nr:heme ABC exporter ATP-binding protein CcmA [Altererythrobacter sp. CAU 1644]WFL78010.1 heme ABC exporter ATP-binding protein CcmA [Altererythrobacter sp. CAU 1644]